MKITGCNFIGFEESNAGDEVLHAVNPSTGSALAEDFYVATPAELEQVTLKAEAAYDVYKLCSASQRAEFLLSIAEAINSSGSILLERVCLETALPLARVEAECVRTCQQLKAFAELLEEGSWVNAVIDTALPDRTPIARPDLRKMQIPLGPIAVFGACNFPLAFSTAGGDTASALAAGNPVIVKGHPSHLGTNELVSRAILTAARETGMPDGVFSMLNGGVEVGQKLVMQAGVKGVGFTGSLKAGQALMIQVQQRPDPIPVYAEMGSSNPVVVLPEKLQETPKGLATTLADSVTLGSGQFCTKPGLIIGLRSAAWETFMQALHESLKEFTGTMLNAQTADSFLSKTATVYARTNEQSAYSVSACVRESSAKDFFLNPQLQDEIFGPTCLLVSCDSEQEVRDVISSLHGQLTGTVFATDTEISQYSDLICGLQERVGRLLFNGVPTGVEVTAAMHHGGPYPAASHAGYTSVGTDAIYRFTRPVCFQNASQVILPDELKDENPCKIWRTINGKKTLSEVTA